MTNKTTTSPHIPHIDSAELIDGWDTNKYTCTYVLNQIRQLEGNGPLSERLKKNLFANGGNGVNYTQDPPQPPPPPKGPSNPNAIIALIQQADDIYKKMLANEVSTAPFAEILLAQGWDGEDPTGRIERLAPENVTSILEERLIKGEFLSELSPQLQFFFRSLAFNAWKVWIRRHG